MKKLRSPLLPGLAAVLGVAAFGLFVLFAYQPFEYPLVGDRAYFVYMGQLVGRGQSIYANSFMGYPPHAALLSALAMRIGEAWSVPSYLAPRPLAIAVALTSVLLLQHFTRRATGSVAAGALAGVVLVSLSQFAPFSVGTLEPKMLVSLFSIAACLAMQSRRWLLAGLATGWALGCWQPALLLLPIGLAIAGGNGRSRGAAAWGLGVVAGLLPTLAYLTIMNGWGDFWTRAVTIPATSQLPSAGASPGLWLAFVVRQLPADLPFLAAAGLGLLLWGFGVGARGKQGLVARVLDPQLAGMPLLLLGWAAFNSLDFQGFADLLPMLPAVAFWAAFSGHRALQLLAERDARRSPARTVTAPIAAFVALLAIGLHASQAALRFEIAADRRLSAQQRLVAEIVRSAGPTGHIDGYLADSLFAISEREAANGFLRLGPVFEQFLELFEPEGCDGLIRKALARKPEVVVIFARPAGVGSCVRKLERSFREAGFARRRIPFPSWWLLWRPGAGPSSDFGARPRGRAEPPAAAASHPLRG